MKVTILGCGPSGGVPLIGNRWGSCNPKNPKNRRLRSSVLVEYDNKAILIDTAPDVRQQLLTNNIPWIDAILYTHIHGDHVHGINDFMVLSRLHQQRIPVYGKAGTLHEIEQSFTYAFQDKGGYKAFLTQHEIVPSVPFDLFGQEVLPIEQVHGSITSLGFRFGAFAYSTDVNFLSPESLDLLKGIKIWVVDCLQKEPHQTHASLGTVQEWVEEIKPEKVYLTHLGIHMDYDEIMQKTPDHIMPAYDGLCLSVYE